MARDDSTGGRLQAKSFELKNNSMSSRTTEIAIFSFNRGDNLRVCVESIKRNAPDVKFTVYDDRSDDLDTLKYLEAIADNVVTAPPPSDKRHGGLCDNMNLALERANHPYLMTLQDDTQLVRPFLPSDDDAISKIFDAYPQVGFVSQLFIKGRALRRYGRKVTPSDKVRAYLSALDERDDDTKSLAYSDIHVAHVGRLREIGWEYKGSERANVRQALAAFGPMPCMADPFAFYCPDVPFYRNRSRGGLSTRLAARVMGRDVKYFTDLTPDKVEQLKSRDLSKWPVAEDYLDSPFPTVRKPFSYHDVKARWWLYALHKLEKLLGY